MLQLNTVQKEIKTFIGNDINSFKLQSHRSEIQSHFNSSSKWVKNYRGWSNLSMGLVVTFMPNHGYTLGRDY